MRLYGAAAAALAIGMLASGLAVASPLQRLAYGPSETECAAAWDGHSALAPRQQISGAHPVRAQIFVGNTSACEIHFLAPGRRLLVAKATWNGHTADQWKITLRPNGWIAPAPSIVLLSDGRVRAGDQSAGVRYRIGPTPKQISGTVTSSG